MLTKRRRDKIIVAKSHCRVSVRGFSIEDSLFPYGELGSVLVCSEVLFLNVASHYFMMSSSSGIVWFCFVCRSP